MSEYLRIAAALLARPDQSDLALYSAETALHMAGAHDLAADLSAGADPWDVLVAVEARRERREAA